MHCHKHVDVPIVCLTFTSETHTFSIEQCGM